MDVITIILISTPAFLFGMLAGIINFKSINFRLPKIKFNKTKPKQLSKGDIILLRLPSSPLEQELKTVDTNVLYQFRVISKYNTGVIVEAVKPTNDVIKSKFDLQYTSACLPPQPLEYELLNRCPVFSIIN